MRKLRAIYTSSQARDILNTADPPAPNPMLKDSYPKLVREVAKLSTVNYSQLMFFRGQHKDYQNRQGKTSLYPSIYRDDYLPREEVRARFETLDAASNELVSRLSLSMNHNVEDLRRYKHIRWAILQHYNVCPTPFLDITQSLHVACSFAVIGNTNEYGFVYVLGMPYSARRIEMNAEELIVNVRLLSICPPEALRPHFQEGFVGATLDVMSEYEDKSELDFNRRLIMKFLIPTDRKFWTKDFGPIPKSLLYPDDIDTVFKDIEQIREYSLTMTRTGDIGEFVKAWSFLEAALRDKKTTKPQYVGSAGSVIQSLVRSNEIDKNVAAQIDNLRTFRNKIVQRKEEISQNELNSELVRLNNVMKLMEIG